jgi:hypothetical protein
MLDPQQLASSAVVLADARPPAFLALASMHILYTRVGGCKNVTSIDDSWSGTNQRDLRWKKRKNKKSKQLAFSIKSPLFQK